MHAWSGACVLACTCLNVHACTCVYVRACMRVRAYVRVCVYVRACVRACKCRCVHVRAVGSPGVRRLVTDIALHGLNSLSPSQIPSRLSAGMHKSRRLRGREGGREGMQICRTCGNLSA